MSAPVAFSSCRVLLQEAKHPLLVLGAGANRKMTSKMLRQFVDTTKIPYCTTQMGKGVIDSREAAAPGRLSC